MTNRQEATFRFDEVSFSIDDTQIIHTLSGSIANGKITTLVVPSGVGQTKLLKLCNGLLSQTYCKFQLTTQSLQSYHPLQLRRTTGLPLHINHTISTTVHTSVA